MNFAAGQAVAGAFSGEAMALAQEVLRSMLLSKLRFLAISFLFLGAVATGARFVGEALARQAGKPNLHQITAKQDRANRTTAPKRMFVIGRVFDPSGKLVVGALIDVIGRPRRPDLGAEMQMAPYEVLGTGTTDRDGRFHLEALRTASNRFFDVIAIGAAPAFGVGWAKLNADAKQPEGDIRLRPEQIIHVRLLDVSGQPATSVEVHVQSIQGMTSKGTRDGISYWPSSNPPEGLRTWPSTYKTDDQGRLVLSGIGRDLSVILTVRDRRFAQQDLYLEANHLVAAKDKETTMALQPVTTIEGRVLAVETDKPIPAAAITVHSRNKQGGWASSTFRADGVGRFQVNPFPSDHFMGARHAPWGPTLPAFEHGVHLD